MSQTVQPTVRLEVESGLPIVDGVYLNGHGPFRFLLDTGEQTNEMEPALARKIGLANSMQLELSTPGGVSSVQAGIVDTVRLGTVEGAGQEFLIVARDGIRSVDPEIRGTLGQQFLSQFDYLLDFKSHRITIDAPVPAGDRVDFHLSAGCMVIPTDHGSLMLDSGAGTLFFFHAGPHLAAAQLTTSNSSVGVESGYAPALRIGGRTYHPDGAAFRQVPDAPADGLLPANLFRSIFVSNSGHFVVFNGGQ
jgi:hypothetical protein